MMLMLEALWLEARYAARSLARRPGLTVVAILTLALGIGANTAIFSVVDVVMLKPLPFHEPNRLVMAWSASPGQGLTEGLTSYPDFKDWREQAKGFDGLAAYWTFPNGDVNLTGGAEPQRVSVARITPGFFEVLGVHPLVGRTFLDEESVVGNHRRVILSYGLWHNQFGADSSLVGKTVSVNGFPYVVVGIMPRELAARSVRVLGTDIQLWRPLVPEDNQTGGRDSRKLHVVGRLAPGVSVGQGEANLAAVAAHLREVHPDSNRDIDARLVPLRELVVRDVRGGLFLLLALVGLVLLGACTTVANLLLIKAAATRKQVDIRFALGASRLRLSVQVLLESLFLGVSGAALGLATAYYGVRMAVALGAAEIPLLADARIDGAVLIFTIVATLLVVVLVGLLPALRLNQPDASTMLRQSASGVRHFADRRIMRSLAVVQITLAMVLLVVGGLLLRSFQKLIQVDPGFEPAHVLTFQLELPMGATMPYAEQPRRDVFFRTLLDRIEALPGVEAATMASDPPLGQDQNSTAFTLRGSADARVFQASMRMTAPEYFHLLGIPVLKGRSFDQTDIESGPRVVVVSAALAQAVWGESDPIGQSLATANGDNEATVIGVVGNVRSGGLDAEGARTVYMPTTQGTFNFMTMLVKVRDEPSALVPSVRGLMKELDPAIPLHHIGRLDDLVAGSIGQQRFQLVTVTAFSLLMLVLAVVGTYGVTAYGVSERTNELGIRAALGASRADIRRLVLGEGIRLGFLGILLGGLAAAALSRVFGRFVYEVSPLDITTFVLVPGVLGLAVFLAAFIPAQRATRADPMNALRSD